MDCWALFLFFFHCTSLFQWYLLSTYYTSSTLPFTERQTVLALMEHELFWVLDFLWIPLLLVDGYILCRAIVTVSACSNWFSFLHYVYKCYTLLYRGDIFKVIKYQVSVTFNISVSFQSLWDSGILWLCPPNILSGMTWMKLILLHKDKNHRLHAAKNYGLLLKYKS